MSTSKIQKESYDNEFVFTVLGAPNSKFGKNAHKKWLCTENCQSRKKYVKIIQFSSSCSSSISSLSLYCPYSFTRNLILHSTEVELKL